MECVILMGDGTSRPLLNAYTGKPRIFESKDQAQRYAELSLFRGYHISDKNNIGRGTDQSTPQSEQRVRGKVKSGKKVRSYSRY